MKQYYFFAVLPSHNQKGRDQFHVMIGHQIKGENVVIVLTYVRKNSQILRFTYPSKGIANVPLFENTKLLVNKYRS